MSQDNVEVVRELFDAWNRRDYAATQEAVNPEIEIEVALGMDLDGTYRGLDGLREVMRFWGAFGEFHSDMEECISAGHNVVVAAHHYGRGRASGAEVEMRNWQVFTLRRGKLVRYGLFRSRDEALEAAGLRE
jgi:ketosteroid isomerase-like protein